MKWSDRIKAELSEWERIDRDIDQQHQFFDSIKSHLMRMGACLSSSPMGCVTRRE